MGLFPLEVAKLASISFVRDVCTGVLGKLLGEHYIHVFTRLMSRPAKSWSNLSRIFPAHPAAWLSCCQTLNLFLITSGGNDPTLSLSRRYDL